MATSKPSKTKEKLFVWIENINIIKMQSVEGGHRYASHFLKFEWETPLQNISMQAGVPVVIDKERIRNRVFEIIGKITLFYNIFWTNL